MEDNAEGNKVARTEEERIEEFKDLISKADGTLIPLKKLTSQEKNLFITARYLEKPENPEDVDVNPWFWGWEDDEYGLPMTSVLLVDVYESDGKQIKPLGHLDWFLSGDYANGGGNMHDASVPKNEHEQLANRYWHKNDLIAFRVDYGNHRQGIGSLIVAASGVVLPTLGVKRFYPGGLLPPAIKTYERFGIRKSDFIGEGWDRHLPIDKLSQSPQVSKSISEFI